MKIFKSKRAFTEWYIVGIIIALVMMSLLIWAAVQGNRTGVGMMEVFFRIITGRG